MGVGGEDGIARVREVGRGGGGLCRGRRISVYICTLLYVMYSKMHTSISTFASAVMRPLNKCKGTKRRVFLVLKWLHPFQIAIMNILTSFSKKS